MAISQEAFITEVQSADSNYLPSPEVLRQMSGLSLGLVYGPAGSGKSTVMAETGLPRVVSDTIRPPRINDGVLEQDGVEYFFRGHDLDEVIADVHAGRFVQMALGPSGSSFYASRASSYPSSGAAIMDVISTTVPEMEALPFGRVTPAAIIAPSYDEWITRLDKRGTLKPDDRAKRIEEASRSLKDALEHEHPIIVNEQLGVAANTLLKLVTDGEFSDHDRVTGRKTASAIYKELTR